MNRFVCFHFACLEPNHQVTRKSLVLIDELGRGTSETEGMVIAWSICEKLLGSNAFIMFVTHYHAMTQFVELYQSQCMNWHMKTAMSQDRVVSAMHDQQSCTASSNSKRS
jgi:DNA mismatch repair ATPase MutS